jgi:hypothetical protein
MQQRKRHLRGLKDLRTTGALGATALAPHAAYMKVTSLELEKLRLSRVRQHAARRIGEIDARCEEIGLEKAALLAAMETPAGGVAGVRQGAPSSQTRRSGGVSLKY